MTLLLTKNKKKSSHGTSCDLSQDSKFQALVSALFESAENGFIALKPNKSLFSFASFEITFDSLSAMCSPEKKAVRLEDVALFFYPEVCEEDITRHFVVWLSREQINAVRVVFEAYAVHNEDQRNESADLRLTSANFLEMKDNICQMMITSKTLKEIHDPQQFEEGFSFLHVLRALFPAVPLKLLQMHIQTSLNLEDVSSFFELVENESLMKYKKDGAFLFDEPLLYNGVKLPFDFFPRYLSENSVGGFSLRELLMSIFLSVPENEISFVCEHWKSGKMFGKEEEALKSEESGKNTQHEKEKVKKTEHEEEEEAWKDKKTLVAIPRNVPVDFFSIREFSASELMHIRAEPVTKLFAESTSGTVPFANLVGILFCGKPIEPNMFDNNSHANVSLPEFIKCLFPNIDAKAVRRLFRTHIVPSVFKFMMQEFSLYCDKNGFLDDDDKFFNGLTFQFCSFDVCLNDVRSFHSTHHVTFLRLLEYIFPFIPRTCWQRLTASWIPWADFLQWMRNTTVAESGSDLLLSLPKKKEQFRLCFPSIPEEKVISMFERYKMELDFGRKLLLSEIRELRSGFPFLHDVMQASGMISTFSSNEFMEVKDFGKTLLQLEECKADLSEAKMTLAIKNDLLAKLMEPTNDNNGSQTKKRENDVHIDNQKISASVISGSEPAMMVADKNTSELVDKHEERREVENEEQGIDDHDHDHDYDLLLKSLTTRMLQLEKQISVYKFQKLQSDDCLAKKQKIIDCLERNAELFENSREEKRLQLVESCHFPHDLKEKINPVLVLDATTPGDDLGFATSVLKTVVNYFQNESLSMNASHSHQLSSLVTEKEEALSSLQCLQKEFSLQSEKFSETILKMNAEETEAGVLQSELQILLNQAMQNAFVTESQLNEMLKELTAKEIALQTSDNLAVKWKQAEREYLENETRLHHVISSRETTITRLREELKAIELEKSKQENIYNQKEQRLSALLEQQADKIIFLVDDAIRSQKLQLKKDKEISELKSFNASLQIQISDKDIKISSHQKVLDEVQNARDQWFREIDCRTLQQDTEVERLKAQLVESAEKLKVSEKRISDDAKMINEIDIRGGAVWEQKQSEMLAREKELMSKLNSTLLTNEELHLMSLRNAELVRFYPPTTIRNSVAER